MAQHLHRQKIGYLPTGTDWAEEVALSHPRVYRPADPGATHPRTVAGVPDGDPAIFRALAACLQGPYHLLYVLHTPRGEGEPGRYQSPEMALTDIDAMLERFAQFLSSDSRYDLWAYSPHDRATVVWDRHNLIHAYGPTDDYAKALEGLDFTVGDPHMNFPHVHHYRAEYDADAAAWLEAVDWLHTPLHEADMQ